MGVIRHARAEGPVVYRAPSGCPSNAEFNARLEKELARRGSSATRDASIVIEHRGDRFVGVLTSGKAESRRERTLDGSSCSDVLDGLILVVGLGAERGSPESDPLEASPAPSEAPRARPRTSEPAARPRPFAGVGAGIVTGLSPSTAPTARLAGGISIGSFLAEGHATLALPNHADSDGVRGSARLLAASLGARGCWLIARRYTAGPCAGVEGVLLQGEGVGADVTRTATHTTLAPTASARFAIPVTDGLAIGVDGLVATPIVRPAFTIDGRHLHRASPVYGRATLSAELWF